MMFPSLLSDLAQAAHGVLPQLLFLQVPAARRHARKLSKALETTIETTRTIICVGSCYVLKPYRNIPGNLKKDGFASLR